jgi:periplasmic protein CpxP/Spy
MSKTKWLSIAVIGLLLINAVMISAVLFKKDRAAGPGAAPGQPPLRPAPKEYIIEQLQLDAAQKTAFEKEVIKHRSRINQLEERILALKNSLYAGLADEKSDPQKDSLVQQLLLVQKEMEETHYNHFAVIKQLCRPEQIALYNELSKEFSAFFMPPQRPPHPPER